METIIWFLFLILPILGIGAGYLLRHLIAKKQVEGAESRALKILDSAQSRAKEILLEAKGKAVKIFEDAKKEEQQLRTHLLNQIGRLEKKENLLEAKIREVEQDKNILLEKAQEVRNIKVDVEQIKTEQTKALEHAASLSREEAKDLLLKKVEAEEAESLAKQIKKLEECNQEELAKKATNIIVGGMQRLSLSQVAETTVSSVAIPDDELKGRIIGREGRNIKSIERLTGAEIIIDDTPGVITISSFSPLRRQIAKMAIEKLLIDGRIHPASIEDAVKSAKEEAMFKIKEAGEAAVYDTGVAGLDPKLVLLLGQLKFRTSYGQNVLLHSIEVAHLSAAIAGELRLDTALAKKAGLLHDIGKAIDHEVEGTHIEIGKAILKKFRISEEVIRVMQAHHQDYPFESPEAIIVYVADAISASRPGARKDSLENYLKRLADLEAIANEFSEVEKSYAIQAGREIRVLVKPDKIDDLGAIKLSRDIADRIEDQLDYPGEIKVSVIRETRATEYAR